jgi:hypothetical protein
MVAIINGDLVVIINDEFTTKATIVEVYGVTIMATIMAHHLDQKD